MAKKNTYKKWQTPHLEKWQKPYEKKRQKPHKTMTKTI